MPARNLTPQVGMRKQIVPVQEPDGLIPASHCLQNLSHFHISLPAFSFSVGLAEVAGEKINLRLCSFVDLYLRAVDARIVSYSFCHPSLLRSSTTFTAFKPVIRPKCLYGPVVNHFLQVS